MELVGGGSVINGATPSSFCSAALWSVAVFVFSSSVEFCSVSVQQLCGVLQCCSVASP